MKSDETAELREELRFIRRELEKITERLRPMARCLSPKEAGKALGVGLTKMRQLIDAGAVKTVVIGKRQMVTLAEIERLTSAAERATARASRKVKGPSRQDWSALRSLIRRT